MTHLENTCAIAVEIRSKDTSHSFVLFVRNTEHVEYHSDPIIEQEFVCKNKRMSDLVFSVSPTKKREQLPAQSKNSVEPDGLLNLGGSSDDEDSGQAPHIGERKPHTHTHIA
jgi:hypothetical protein